MSINRSHAPNGAGVVLFYGERLLIFYNGCGLNLSCFKETFDGKVYLTSHRAIFTNKKMSGRVLSLSIPLINIKNIDLKQPVFGPNRVTGRFIAEENGGLQGELQFSLSFNHGGAIEFGKTLSQLQNRTNFAQATFAPPPYSDFSSGVQQYYDCPPPAYVPPVGDPYYGFVQQHQAFSTPEEHTLFHTGAPPPYPGVAPVLGSGWTDQPHSPSQKRNSLQYNTATTQGLSGKQVTTGYHFPEDTHVVFVPPSAPPADSAASNFQTNSHPTNGLPPYSIDTTNPPPYLSDKKNQ